MTRSLLISLISLIPGMLYSQFLKIGDTIPNIEYTSVINYKSPTLHLSEFNSKLTILDFWSHNCPGCIEDFPNIEAMQKQFGGKIQFILVNTEGKDSTLRFFSRRSKIELPRVPFITEDSILNSQFPHSGSPYHVWIDSNGIIINTPSYFHTTAKNVAKYLKGDDLRFPKSEKGLYIPSLFDRSYDMSNGYFSYISHCRDEGGLHLTGFEQDSSEITSYGCASALGLFQMAYDGPNLGLYERPGRTVLIAKNPFKYITPNDLDSLSDWYINYSYYFQLLVPKYKAKFKYQYMKEDLKRYLGLSAGIEQREVNCITLIGSPDKNKLASKGGPPSDTFLLENIVGGTNQGSICSMENAPFSKFVSRIQNLIENALHLPFINDVDYVGNIDITFNGSILDSLTIPALDKELKRYGLRLIRKKCLIPVLVLREQ
jgi:thiol-disulfide isomerase/thioredoxin